MLVKSILSFTALARASAAIASAAINVKPLDGGCFEVVLDGATVSPVSGVNDTTPTWQCDIRVWTRAPDLSPGRNIPADARLAANGSACGDIVKWEVGMRLKERALIKMKAKGVELPPKPIEPVWNESRIRHNDYNDVFAASVYFSQYQDPAEREYDDAMDVYQEKLRNASLWFVRAEERVVYDVTREMGLQPTNPERVELTEAFAVHMPWTNFPPIERSHSSSTGKDNQILTTETLSEFYHLLTLSNGTVLDLPSGDIGIVPVQSAVKPPADIKQSSIGDIEWPQTVHFEPTLRNTSKDDSADPEFRYAPMAPACDDGNLATFTLTVDSNITQPVLGQNITLNFTLTRTGNGSEYPASIDVAHGADRNITWAYQFVSNQSEYMYLLTTSGRDVDRHMYGPPFQRMKMASTDKELQDAKEREESRMNGAHPVYFSSMMRHGYAQARHDLWDEDREPREVYNFGLEIILTEKDYPSFEKTFESVRSSLAFTLHTYFACDVRENEDDLAPNGPDPESGPVIPALDKEWVEYELPTRKSKRASMRRLGIWYRQHQSMPLDAAVPMAIPAQAEGNDEVEIVHYMAKSARGPALSARVDDDVSLPLLEQAIREEAENEHMKVRWSYDSRRGMNGWCEREGAPRDCYEQNGGGGGKLASKMWQSKEARQKDALGVRGGGGEPRAGRENQRSSFVIQP